MDSQPIVTQPGVGSNSLHSNFNTNYSDWTTQDSAKDTAAPEHGVSIRTMTTADAAFVARCLITGFQAKVEHHIPRDKVEAMIGLHSQMMSNLPPHAQRRIFVAECSGKPAGIAMMKFHNVSDSSPGDNPGDSSIPYCSTLGCCNVLRLSRLKWLHPTAPEGHIMLDVLSVMDGFRGKGIGKALLVAVDKRAQEENLQGVVLWCAYENPALRLYLRHGYIEEQFITGSWRASCATGVDKWHYMVRRL